MIRRKSHYGNNYWWGCPMFPICRITATEHPDGSLMSVPADETLKGLKRKAHSLAEQIFGSWKNKESKAKLYSWMKNNTKSGHIGLMYREEVEGLTKTFERMVEDERVKEKS